MSTHQRSTQTTMMLSFAMEASLSVWGLWSLVAREQMGWKTGAALFTMSLLLIQGLRAIRSIQLINGVSPELRSAFVGMAVSLAGWIAMIILFTIITLYPELDVPMSTLIPAFLCHIGGALLAMRALNKSAPPSDESP